VELCDSDESVRPLSPVSRRDERAKIISSLSEPSDSKNMVMSRVRVGTKSHYAGEDQQEFKRPNDRATDGESPV
jgi:hypothetical protein